MGQFQAPVQAQSEATEPVTLARDPQPLRIANVIRYHETDQGHNLDQYSANLTDGDDAIRQFLAAIQEKSFNGVPIRSCALIVGGFGQGNSVHGGEQVASWSAEGGSNLPAGWDEKVANRKPAPVVAQTSARSIGDDVAPATNVIGSDATTQRLWLLPQTAGVGYSVGQVLQFDSNIVVLTAAVVPSPEPGFDAFEYRLATEQEAANFLSASTEVSSGADPGDEHQSN